MPMLKSLIMSTKHRHNYHPISEDRQDMKIPLYSEESFEHGVSFRVKFVGSSEIGKPNNRAEIVAVMRRIRYEFKTKSVKKRQANLVISIDGLRAKLAKRNSDAIDLDEKDNLIMEYPIYRVFYVSHDSLDLKIFSFIVRDADTNIFRCYVFKEFKKNEAMHIVRTIGQAFDVCHKLSLKDSEMKPNEIGIEDEGEKSSENYLMSIVPPEADLNSVQTKENSPVHFLPSAEITPSEQSLKHQMQFMQEQIQHLQQQSDMTTDEIKFIKEQLNLETNARLDAQKKNNDLLEQNQQLLTHVQQLLLYIQQLEAKLRDETGHVGRNVGFSRPNDLFLMETSMMSSTHPASDISHGSPDSGKGNEISSESLSDPFHDQSSSAEINPFPSTNHRTIDDHLTLQLTSFTNFAFHPSPLRLTTDPTTDGR